MCPPPDDGGDAGPGGDANPFGYVDHSPFAELGANLVWGERNGVMLRIEQVASGLACDCICPACRGVLVAKKGPDTAHHFAHHAAGGGCGTGRETNAHLWAKDVLDRTRTIWTPPVHARRGRHDRTSHASREMTFAKAILERRSGHLVPDVVLILDDGREMLVEIQVTHRCGPDKVAKLRTARLTTIEVNLSALRKSGDRAVIEATLLRYAPRHWLFNAKLDALQAAVDDAVHADEAAAAAAEQRRLDRAARTAQAATRAIERDVDRLLAAGRNEPPAEAGLDPDEIGYLFDVEVDDRVTVPVDGPGFLLSRMFWQAAIVARMLRIDDIRTYSPPHFSLEDVMATIADCIHPAFHRVISKDVRAAVRARAPRFRFPDETVAAYLEELCNASEIAGTGWGYELSADTQDWIESEQARLRGLDQRRGHADALLDRIIEALPPAETIDFDIPTWRTTAIGDPPMTPLASITAGDMRWNWLEQQLRVIAMMVSGGEDPATETLGLPLDAANERARERRQMRLDGERAERVEMIRRQARQGLGLDAEMWLTTPLINGLAPALLAGRDAGGLAEAQAALSAEIVRREQARKAAALTGALQGKLRMITGKTLQPKFVELFLTTTDPELGCSPLARCTDEHGYRLALERLDRAAARQRRGR